MAGQQNNDENNQSNRRLFLSNDANAPESDQNSERINLLDINEIIQRAAEAREKWNFDFENEQPLEGDWVWEKVNGSEEEDGDSRETNENDFHNANILPAKNNKR